MYVGNLNYHGAITDDMLSGDHERARAAAIKRAARQRGQHVERQAENYTDGEEVGLEENACSRTREDVCARASVCIRIHMCAAGKKGQATLGRKIKVAQVGAKYGPP
jgi:hypothetical protein